MKKKRATAAIVVKMFVIWIIYFAVQKTTTLAHDASPTSLSCGMEDGVVGSSAGASSPTLVASSCSSSSTAAAYCPNSPNTRSNPTLADEEGNKKKNRRGKVLVDPLNVEDMYEAYREIRSNYHDKALLGSMAATSSSHNNHHNNNWKILNVKDGVEVALLEHEDDPTCPYVRLKAILPVPVQDCWDFLRVANWDKTMPIMDPFYEGVSVYSDGSNNSFNHSSVNMLLCRKRMKRIFAFGKRDLVFLSVTENEPLEDGTWVSGTVSVQTNQIPRQEGYTRAFQDSVAFYKPIPDQNHTALTIVCRIDLNDSAGDGGGWIPMWLYTKTIGITGAQSILRMQKALVDAAAGTQDASSFGQ